MSGQYTMGTSKVPVACTYQENIFSNSTSAQAVLVTIVCMLEIVVVFCMHYQYTTSVHMCSSIHYLPDAVSMRIKGKLLLLYLHTHN